MAKGKDAQVKVILECPTQPKKDDRELAEMATKNFSEIFSKSLVWYLDFLRTGLSQIAMIWNTSFLYNISKAQGESLYRAILSIRLVIFFVV